MSERFENLTKRLAGVGQGFDGGAGPNRRSMLVRAAAAAGAAALFRGLGGAAAQDGGVGDEGGVEAEGERPGRYSRRYGIERWRVNRQAGGYEVKFRHEDRRLSGTIEVTYGGGRQTTFTSQLRLDDGRFQLAFSGERFSGTTPMGDRFVAEWNRKRERWEADAESERAMRRSDQEFAISVAVAADLAPGQRRSGTSQNLAETRSQARCITNFVYASSGPIPSLTKPDACDIAEAKMTDACNEQAAPDCADKGCCDSDEIAAPCFDLIPLVSGDDFGCTCAYRGKGYLAC